MSETAVVHPAEVSRENLDITGRWLRVARIKDEGFREDEVLPTADFPASLKALHLGADLFAFVRKPGTGDSAYPFYREWMNLAVIETRNFQDWWEKELSQVTRKNVRRAARRGVVIKQVQCDDNLARGITEIYNEIPIRDGRPFRHYGKTFDVVKREVSTMPDRSEFFAAYFGEELIGFLKLVHMGRVSSVLHIISRRAHSDKRPSNALVAAAAEACSRRGAEYLIYGQYHYGSRSNGPLTEFKRRNGFKMILVPRYVIPLTVWGKISLSLRLHRGLKDLLPTWFVDQLLRIRSNYYEKQLEKFLSLQGVPTSLSDADVAGRN
jgi:Acetyltransferase (GNAT) domain